MQKTESISLKTKEKLETVKLRLSLVESDSISRILLNILELKLCKTETGNIMLMMLQKNWIEQILSFWRSGSSSVLAY